MSIKSFIHIFIISIILFTASTSIAQSNDDDVKSLGDILNPKTDYDNDGKALTAASMANNYYNSCIDKNNFVFDEIEKNILCSCTAAKMSENLTVDDFMALDKKTAKGKDARGRMLAYSYAPCMEYVVDKKVSTDCYISKSLDDIVIGKSHICKCVADRFKQHINRAAPSIITSSMLNEPMTLDPLGYYFKNRDYYAQHKVFMGQCRFDFEYHRDNKR